MKRYKYEELCDIYENGENPWWIIGDNHNERMFYTAVYHQMMSNMCLNNEYHPDYAGGVVDKWMFKYYENAHDLIYWKTYDRGRTKK
tara:strand:- start:24602 stop:24862 length:261 start_codon:yes stop_codon:yes gene_type:complete